MMIEANCRLHGGEGTWAPMAEACLGYSAVSAMLDAYLDPAAFAAIPTMPVNFRAHAKEAKVPRAPANAPPRSHPALPPTSLPRSRGVSRLQIRSGVAGKVVEIDAAAMESIRALKSYQSEMVGTAVGKRVEKTIDLLTSYGNVNLVNESLDDLERDYKTFHDIVGRGIFKVEA